MDSLKMIGELEARGVLTKQAGHRLRLQRQTMIRNELVKEAGKLGRLLSDAKDAFVNKGHAFANKGMGAADRTLGPAMYRLSRERTDAGGSLGMGHAGANILKLMALAGMATGASAGINAGINHSRDKKLNGEIENSYGQLLAENPDLAKRDPELVRKHFEVLSRYAPSLAANPTVAASMIGESSFKGGMGGQTVKMMTDIQSQIDRIHQGRSAFGDSPVLKHLPVAASAIRG